MFPDDLIKLNKVVNPFTIYVMLFNLFKICSYKTGCLTMAYKKQGTAMDFGWVHSV